MYSLYRAWFGGAEETYPRLETLSPPDTLVRVGNEGEHQFVAHRGVLAAHSGYLKALLATNSTTTTNSSARDDTNQNSTAVTSVSVSSVGGEAFAPLLNYMYTGRLEVTLENIYSVLLATHLLHMPGALEQCRAALLRLRGPPPPAPSSSSSQLNRPGTILRPVPNRPVAPPLCWSQPTLYPTAAHVGLSHLSNFQLTPGLSILPSPAMLREATTTAQPYSFRQSPSPPGGALELRTSRSVEPRAPSPRVPSSSFRHAPEAREKLSEEIRDEENEEDDRISIEDSSPGSVQVNEAPSHPAPNDRGLRQAAESPRSRTEETSASTSSGNGVVYDIACCDGPVRFHRVLNENYVSTSASAPARQIASTGDSLAQEDHDSDRGNADNPAENDENDENGKPDGDSGAEGSRGAGSSVASASYTCGYCRHTFKSHYCYRKHARRHLLPSSVTDPTATRSNVPGDRPDGRRREVKLLDLNVQYYPCKICGSKFPSYYFVHKHKKLCHANVEENPVVGNPSERRSGNLVPQSTSNSSDQ